ncbi:MAG: Adenylosuccinate synthetase [Candidatus Levybacteria bacterium GW2011_GWA2_40_8]|nr:MAG: Adenylosuccinate synthetase [Candidatus Levybacteria bacterium GW2011_GWA2_40_8]
MLTEISDIEKAGIRIKDRLFISPRCNIIMPYHKLLDKLYEEAKGPGKIGTTGRGIGPVYADKVSYNGIRIADLLDSEVFSEKLQTQLRVKNKILKALGAKPLSQSQIERDFAKYRTRIKPFVSETFSILNDAYDKKKNILMEGAQGVFLDNDFGTYPYVTASNVISGSASSGAGIAPAKVRSVIGVTKAYTTRVGAGPFPTELTNKLGDKLQTGGLEFGATTGRKRRCGWLDLELIRFAAKINGFTEICITKLDVLDNFPKIKICTHYRLNGRRIKYEDCDLKTLEKAKPVYKTYKGWMKSIKDAKNFRDLPKEAQIYLRDIEKMVGVEITYVSTGVKRNEIIKI